MKEITQQEWYYINQIISDVYSSEPDNMLLNVCTKLKELIDFDKSFSNLSSNKNNVNSFFLYQSIDIDEEMLDKYINYYVDVDYCAWFTIQPIPSVYRNIDLVSEENKVKSIFYKEWLAPMNMYYGCGTCIASNKINYGNITFFRSRDKGTFTNKDLEILEVVNTHICQRFSQLYPSGINHKSLKKSLDYFQSKYNLTNKEYEIIRLVQTGTEINDLTNHLFISENTLKKHLSNIYAKLKVNSRAQFIKLIYNS